MTYENIYEKYEAKMQAMKPEDLGAYLKTLPWGDGEWTLATALRIALETIGYQQSVIKAIGDKLESLQKTVDRLEGL